MQPIAEDPYTEGRLTIQATMKRASQFALPLLLIGLTVVLAGCGGPNLVERLSGGFLGYGICGTIILVLDLLALVQVVGMDWKFGRKAMWALIIIFFPLGGLLLWWFFGK